MSFRMPSQIMQHTMVACAVGACVAVVVGTAGIIASQSAAAKSRAIQQEGVDNAETAAQLQAENQANQVAGQIAASNANTAATTDASLYNSQYAAELNGAAQAAQTAIAANNKAAQAKSDLIKEVIIGGVILVTAVVLYENHKQSNQ